MKINKYTQIVSSLKMLVCVCRTFALHAFDPVGAEAVTMQLLLQIKCPLSIDLIVRNAIVLVTSPCARPL